MKKETAQSFLREAVFRSRDSQAVRATMTPGPGALGTCGLGEKAAVVLDLADRGRELFDTLWPDGLPEERLEQVRDVMRDWIKKQDALDRKRNHFIKAFRQDHGLDRADYEPDVEAAFERGLEQINAEAAAGQLAAAERLLEI